MGLTLVVLALVTLSILPTLLASRQRPLRLVRAWALGGQLLDDRGVMFQTNRSDCGYACVMMAVRHHGLAIPDDLINDAAQARVGLSVGELTERSTRLGLRATIVRVPRGCLSRALDRLPLPAIALVGTHFVLIETRTEAGAVIMVDPGIGRLRAPLQTLERNWRDVIVAFGVSKEQAALVCL